MSETEEEKGIAKRVEEFLQVFKKGADFTQELLKENERLRYKVLDLENALNKSGGMPIKPAEPDPEVLELRRRVAELEKENSEILDRIRHVEAENLSFANRYVDIEAENNNLANLYIASYQLHSTLDFREVLQVIMEIIINLIGAEEFGILLLDEKTNKVEVVATEGVEAEDIPTMEVGEGIIGKVAQTGENYFVKELDSYQKDYDRPIVCIPLKIKDHVIGVIAIYKLFVQKSHFAEVDYELFTLLAGHAATAIFSSKLYSESERKLSTIQGFIELLTQ